mmetsp:Transcript_47038/g.117301  ORF Transcript_47038/g.117301 Transcript_47038/m.117301 type:complete len:210 (-) Transcript_47038:2811-3440(-)
MASPLHPDPHHTHARTHTHPHFTALLHSCRRQASLHWAASYTTFCRLSINQSFSASGSSSMLLCRCSTPMGTNTASRPTPPPGCRVRVGVGWPVKPNCGTQEPLEGDSTALAAAASREGGPSAWIDEGRSVSASAAAWGSWRVAAPVVSMSVCWGVMMAAMAAWRSWLRNRPNTVISSDTSGKGATPSVSAGPPPPKPPPPPRPSAVPR